MSGSSPVSLRARAEFLAADRLREKSGFAVFRDSPAGYVRRPEQNLLPGIAPDDIWLDLRDGAGNELVDDERGPAKFCAAFSSSALAVNTFGRFRRRPAGLQLAGLGGFSALRFEKQLPTGLKGTPPHLDLYAEGQKGVVCVESKFLETLWPKQAKFAASYERAVAALAEPGWGQLYGLLKGDPGRFQHLDSAQLVKHYLGMRKTLREARPRQVLLYLYWEPEDAAAIEVYVRHREEVRVFTEMVSDSRIEFLAMSYTRLWDEWRALSASDGTVRHLDRLCQRYVFPLQDEAN